MNGVTLNSKMFGPFSYRFILSKKVHFVTAASIALLFFCSCPPAICGFVVPIEINSVQRMLSRRPPADVRNEIKKADSIRQQPFGADTYSATAVAVKLPVGELTAAPSHIAPSVIFWRESQAVHFAATRREFAFQASAAFTILSPKAICRNELYSSTITTAKPKEMSDVTHYFPSPESESGDIFQFHHARSLLGVGFAVNKKTIATLSIEFY